MDYPEKIYRELVSENATILFVADNFGKKIILKVPSTVTRSIIKGCPIELTFGNDTSNSKSIIHAGARVYDDPINFIVLSGSRCNKQEVESIISILEEGGCFIELYNELAVCVATSKIFFDKSHSNDCISMIGTTSKLYFGDFSDLARRSLDAFDYSLDNNRKFNNPYTIDTKIVKCTLQEWQINQTHFICENGVNSIHIDDPNEGGVLETQVGTVLDDMFGKSVHLNPFFKTAQGQNELTDILAYYPLGIFLIETKAISILNETKERSMDRKVSNLKKQIRKGIKQLVGAKNNIKKGTKIYNSYGEITDIKRDVIPHCIVLVSEILQFGEWDDLVQEIIETMRKENIILHVMDLLEFMKFVKVSSSKKEHFDYFLINRFKSFMDEKSMFLRVNFIPEK